MCYNCYNMFTIYLSYYNLPAHSGPEKVNNNMNNELPNRKLIFLGNSIVYIFVLSKSKNILR